MTNDNWMSDDDFSMEDARAEDSLEPSIADIRAYVWDMITEGFMDRESIIREIHVSVFDARPTAAWKVDVALIIDQLLHEFDALQATWTTPTDCDRLDTALSSLEQQGIRARQCCSLLTNCSPALLLDEIEEQPNQRAIRGGVFYDKDDVQRARKDHWLFLTFCSTGADLDTVAVGRLIVQALREAGLKPFWSGEASQRICIMGFKWMRRRPYMSNPKASIPYCSKLRQN